MKLLVLQEYKLIPGHLTLIRRRAIICSIAEMCNDHLAVIREGCLLYLISCGIAVRGRILRADFDPSSFRAIGDFFSAAKRCKD
jgi:hypothetical protein